jgi:hypothetical protein
LNLSHDNNFAIIAILIKSSMHSKMSLIQPSAIYKEALNAYVQQKEKERWKKAVALMSDEYENNPELTDWLNFEEDFYDYKTV